MTLLQLRAHRTNENKTVNPNLDIHWFDAGSSLRVDSLTSALTHFLVKPDPMLGLTTVRIQDL
jgi:ethanolamine ammonia-lyase small subunit